MTKLGLPPSQRVLASKGPQATREFGRLLATQLFPGSIILLVGEMGAGKTVFAQGLALGLGVTAPVTSPTFTLAGEYREGRIPFCHIDLYRLGAADPFLEFGLDEYLNFEGVTAIEWPEVLAAALPPDYVAVTLQHGGEDLRLITLAAAGERGEQALRRFLEALNGSGRD